MRKARDLGLQGCQNKLPVDVIVCMFVSLAVSRVRVNLPEFPSVAINFSLVNFLMGTNTIFDDIPTYSVLDFL